MSRRRALPIAAALTAALLSVAGCDLEETQPEPAATTEQPPSPTPSPTPAEEPEPTEEPEALDPRFDTCGEANEAGYGPYEQGEDKEYDWYRDADGDGVVCES